MTRGNIGGKIILGVLAFVGLTFLFGLVVQSLWNTLMPVIFNLPTITYWQAFGLLILSHILFHGKTGVNIKSHWRDHQWREQFAERIAEMTPEQRERFKREWDQKCCFSDHKKQQDTDK